MEPNCHTTYSVIFLLLVGICFAFKIGISSSSLIQYTIGERVPTSTLTLKSVRAEYIKITSIRLNLYYPYL